MTIEEIEKEMRAIKERANQEIIDMLKLKIEGLLYQIRTLKIRAAFEDAENAE